MSMIKLIPKAIDIKRRKRSRGVQESSQTSQLGAFLSAGLSRRSLGEGGKRPPLAFAKASAESLNHQSRHSSKNDGGEGQQVTVHKKCPV